MKMHIFEAYFLSGLLMIPSAYIMEQNLWVKFFIFTAIFSIVSIIYAILEKKVEEECSKK